MYECMYVCMYVRTYVYECMYVCMHVCMYECMYVYHIIHIRRSGASRLIHSLSPCVSLSPHVHTHTDTHTHTHVVGASRLIHSLFSCVSVSPYLTGHATSVVLRPCHVIPTSTASRASGNTRCRDETGLSSQALRAHAFLVLLCLHP